MDLRDWLDVLRKNDRLQEIDVETDWNLEAPAISVMANRVAHKGVLFNNVKGYPDWRLFGSTVSQSSRKRKWETTCLMLDLPVDMSRKAHHKEFERRINTSIPPTEVAPADAPCKEIISIGKEANVFDLPVPYLHSTDGGRYLSWHAIVQKDPDTGWTNYGCYRVMCIGPRKLSALLLPMQQGGAIYYQQYDGRGENCPFCIAIGGDPILFLTYVFGLPTGVCELDLAGALRGEPIRVVRAETNDLLVPADAEVIIEGEILAGKMVDEGPFAEFSGYVHGRMKNPEFRVHCITRRNKPVLPFACMTMSMDEDNTVMSTTIEQEHMITLKESGTQFVDIVHGPDNPNFQFGAVKDPDNIGEITRFVDELTAHKLASYENWFMMTDPDVNIDSIDRAFREFGLNTDSRKDLHVSDLDAFNNPLLFDTPYDERSKMINQSKIWIDATTGRKPKEQKPKRNEFEVAFPESVKDKARENWSRLGFDRPFEEMDPVDPDWLFKA